MRDTANLYEKLPDGTVCKRSLKERELSEDGKRYNVEMRLSRLSSLDTG